MEEHQNMSMDVDTGEDLFEGAEDLLPEEEDGNQTAEESDEEEQESAEKQGEPEEGNEPAQQQEEVRKDDDDWYDLKHLRETKRVNRQEVMELAQQGLDYRRVTEQRDALRSALQAQTDWRGQNEGVLQDLQAVAKASGQDVGDFVRSLRVNLLMKQENMTRVEANERILREEAEKKLEEKQQADFAGKQRQMEQTRAQKDIAAFVSRYPDVDVKSIPEDVFRRAATGETNLIGAYTDHLNGQLKAENEKLQAELAAERQNKTNKQKAVGSAKTEGANAKHDDFLSGFNE